MSVNIFFAAPAVLWPEYAHHLPEALQEAGVEASIRLEAPDPAAVDYIIYAPASPVQDLTPFTRTKLVQNLWAGVERIVGNPTLTMPLARMVDPGLTEGMVEYVTGHVLRYHLGMDAHFAGQDGVWRNSVLPPLARERSVAVLGLGELGSATAETLAGLNFRVLGWSRRQKDIAGVECHSGEDGLQRVLARAEIVVLLLPSTPDTANTLNAARLASLPVGARIINPGRGTLIDDTALLAALDSGHIAHATLDVFRTEPLPAGHPYWAHPNVTVTPHIAADTRAVTASRVVAENIRRGIAGQPFLHLVDRRLGY
jgi:glyoxylate/hydroxypyruvate reductase A